MNKRVKQLLLSGALTTVTIAAQAAVPTASELRGYLLNPTVEPDGYVFDDYDSNSDGQIDIADLVHLIKQDGVVDIVPVFKIGAYTGVFQSNTVVATDATGSNETLPLEIEITGLEPPTGVLDNIEDSFSLYFPSGSFQLENFTIVGNSVNFEIRVESTVPLISDEPITRLLSFDGELSLAGQATVIGGTYTEIISGFEDVQGTSLDVVRTGNFALFQE
jgi:hypothetical protein